MTKRENIEQHHELRMCVLTIEPDVSALMLLPFHLQSATLSNSRVLPQRIAPPHLHYISRTYPQLIVTLSSKNIRMIEEHSYNPPPPKSHPRGELSMSSSMSHIPSLPPNPQRRLDEEAEALLSEVIPKSEPMEGMVSLFTCLSVTVC